MTLTVSTRWRGQAYPVSSRSQRVRPILMTSSTTIPGLLPLVLFSRSDANIWNALAFTD